MEWMRVWKWAGGLKRLVVMQGLLLLLLLLLSLMQGQRLKI
jgi:hypothetical protein